MRYAFPQSESPDFNRVTTGLYPSFVIRDASITAPLMAILGTHLTCPESAVRSGRSDRRFCAAGRRSRFSGLGRITWSMATVRARCDMNEITRLDSSSRCQAPRGTTYASPDRSRTFVSVPTARSSPSSSIESHRSAHEVQELVAVRMDLTTVWSGPLDVGHCPDCVSRRFAVEVPAGQI